MFTTMPKNFHRFVCKVGPLAKFQDKICSLLSWENPPETLLLMAVYGFLCFQPILIMFIPHLILFHIISNNYSSRLTGNISKKTKPLNPSQYYPDHINYSKNLQFIQNTMGMYADAFENFCVLNTQMDWSDESKTLIIIQYAIVSFILLIALVFYIHSVPWNWVFLVSGWTGLLMNTSIGRALHHQSMDHIRKLEFSKWLKELKKIWKRNHSYGASKVIIIECCENQRWWAGYFIYS